jgi:two-component system, OmpR family, sensor histidine kinase TctE
MNANVPPPLPQPSTPRLPTNGAVQRVEPSSLFSEILDWMLVPFLLVWPLSVCVTYLIGIEIANSALDQSLGAKGRALSEQVVWVGANNKVELRADLRTILPDEDAESNYFRIDSSKGELLLGEPELPIFGPLQIFSPDTAIYKTAEFRDSEVRIAAIERREASTGAKVIVYVAESLTKRKKLAYEIMKGIVLPQIIVVPLMIFLMWLGLRRGVAPLKQLRERMVARDAHDLRPLDAGNAPEEVEPLIIAFNDLLQRVENEGAAQKRFIANAAHQLRTPLAGIRMQAELALRNIGDSEKNAALLKIASGTARTAHLVNQLLMLARSEGAAASALPLAAINLIDLAREVVADGYPAAAAKQIALSFEAADASLFIEGHGDLLRELISNLLDNAIHYTPANGTVLVRVQTAPVAGADGVLAVLEVEDDGIGIPVAEQELVFERFYRVLSVGYTSANAVENMGSVGSAGSGIGLAIVREIAMRHGATVSVATPESGKGCVFTVTFKKNLTAK